MKQSAYKTRIENALAKLSFGKNAISMAKFKVKLDENGQLPTTIFGGDEFSFEKFYYSVGQVCDLCGHNPIKRVYVIKSVTTKKEAHIGCECAKNYIDADVVDGLARQFNFEYNKVVNPIKYEEEMEALNWAVENKVRLPYCVKAANVEKINYKYDLVNVGSPSSVIQKIKAGKAVTKREKQVMAVWKYVYENRHKTALIQAFNTAANEYAKVIIEEQYRGKIEALNAEMQNQHSDLYEKAKELTVADDYIGRKVKEFLAAYEKGHYVVRTRYYNRVEGGVNAYQVTAVQQALKDSGDKKLVTDAIAKVGENEFLSNLLEKVGRGITLTERQVSAVERLLEDNSEVDELVAKAEKADFSPKKREFIDSICNFYKTKGYISNKQLYYLRKAVS